MNIGNVGSPTKMTPEICIKMTVTMLGPLKGSRGWMGRGFPCKNKFYFGNVESEMMVGL